jgi:hypothetical protein
MTPSLEHYNSKLRLSNTQLQTDALQSSILSEPAVAGDAQIFLQDYTAFLDNQVLLIEDFGAETAEIVTVNGNPTVNGGAIFDSVLVRSHPVGSKVYIIDFDQVEFSHATTATGSKTTLSTTLGSGIVALQADTKVQIYNEAQFSSGYYFARYKNSISGVFSDYTDPLVYGGWTGSTVGYMIERSLRDVGEDLSAKVTRFDCYEWVTTGIRLIQGKLKRWPEHYSYNAVLGQMQRGDNTTTMPTDAYDTETNKSIIAVRVGDSSKLIYLSPGDFEENLSGVRHTTVTTQATSGQTSLTIDNSYDFDDSGYVSVYVSNTKYSVRYTAVTRGTGGTGVLTGIPASGTGAITVTIPALTDVWQNEEEGTPTWYTVRNAQIETWPLADSAHDNANIYGDYAKVATSVDSDGDVIDLQRFDMLQDYLSWRIEAKARNNGVLSMGTYIAKRFVPNSWYAQFTEKLNDAIKTLPSNNTFRIRPSMNRIGGIRTGRTKANINRIPIDQQ